MSLVVSDRGGGLVIAHDIDDMRQAKVADSYAKAVGNVLLREYPGVIWHVRINLAMGMAGITIPAVSRRYGISVHLSRNTRELERRTIQVGGEIMERFHISRRTGNTEHLRSHKNIAGEVRSASAGELLKTPPGRRGRR